MRRKLCSLKLEFSVKCGAKFGNFVHEKNSTYDNRLHRFHLGSPRCDRKRDSMANTGCRRHIWIHSTGIVLRVLKIRIKREVNLVAVLPAMHSYVSNTVHRNHRNNGGFHHNGSNHQSTLLLRDMCRLDIAVDSMTNTKLRMKIDWLKCLSKPTWGTRDGADVVVTGSGSVADESGQPSSSSPLEHCLYLSHRWLSGIHLPS